MTRSVHAAVIAAEKIKEKQQWDFSTKGKRKKPPAAVQDAAAMTKGKRPQP